MALSLVRMYVWYQILPKMFLEHTCTRKIAMRIKQFIKSHLELKSRHLAYNNNLSMGGFRRGPSRTHSPPSLL